MAVAIASPPARSAWWKEIRKMAAPSNAHFVMTVKSRDSSPLAPPSVPPNPSSLAGWMNCAWKRKSVWQNFGTERHKGRGVLRSSECRWNSRALHHPRRSQALQLAATTRCSHNLLKKGLDVRRNRCRTPRRLCFGRISRMPGKAMSTAGRVYLRKKKTNPRSSAKNASCRLAARFNKSFRFGLLAGKARVFMFPASIT